MFGHTCSTLSPFSSRFDRELPTRHLGRPVFLLVIFFVFLAGHSVHGLFAQEVEIGVKNQSVSEGFFEYHGTSWTLVGPNALARFGPTQRQVSPFPVFESTPPAVGLGVAGSRTRGEFYGYWSQGFQRSHQSIVLSETLSDGIYGSFACQSVRPFVVGFQPVFASSVPGTFQPSPMPQVKTFADGLRMADKWTQLMRRQGQGNKASTQQPDRLSIPLDQEPPLVLTRDGPQKGSEVLTNREEPRLLSGSSAERVVMSVEEARALRQAELDHANRRAQEYLGLVESAMACGQKEQARIYLRMAEKYASGDLRERVVQLQKDLTLGEK